MSATNASEMARLLANSARESPWLCTRAIRPIEAWSNAAGIAKATPMTMPFFTGVCRSVTQSDLVALVPHQFAERAAGPKGLAIYQLPMPIEPVHLNMIWHKRSTSNPAHRWVRERIANILIPLDGPGENFRRG